MPSARRSSPNPPSETKALAASSHEELLPGFVRLRILRHAAKASLVGFWNIEDLARHGYRFPTADTITVTARI